MNKTKIYLVTNCYGDPNKVYIGKEKYPKKQNSKRYYNHKITFGKDIKFSYIDECNTWERDGWEYLERYWIEQFRHWGFTLQNKNKGGAGVIVLSKKARNSISKARINYIKKYGVYDKTKPIIQYDLNGIFIKEWKSGKEYADSNNLTNGSLISACLKGKIKTAYNSLWRYKNNSYIKVISKPKFNFFQQKITQYDLLGNKIKNWDSIKEAGDVLKINKQGICNCLKNRAKQAYGFKWKYNN